MPERLQFNDRCLTECRAVGACITRIAGTALIEGRESVASGDMLAEINARFAPQETLDTFPGSKTTHLSEYAVECDGPEDDGLCNRKREFLDTNYHGFEPSAEYLATKKRLGL